jgi:membrane protein DedA with SNARE-associated domain
VIAIALFALAGILLGGVISLVRQGATRFSIAVVAVLAALATVAAVAWLLPGDSR